MTPDIANQIAELLNTEYPDSKLVTQEAILANKINYLFHANQRNKLISCIECRKVQWYQYEFRQLTTQRTFRKNGHAQSLLNKAINHAKANWGRVIQCTIEEGDLPSENLFESNGFTQTSIFYYPDNEVNMGVWQKVISCAV